MYLGLDLSTQQLKAAIINNDFQVLQEAFIHFDTDLPEFRTSGGVIKNENQEITSPPVMWIKALDMLLEKLQFKGVNFNEINAISGCAQQHGTVYWKEKSNLKLRRLDPSKYLYEELSNCFSLKNSPIWMDSSTKQECILLEDAFGGPKKMAEITGSKAYERYSAAQIAKVARKEKNKYLETERISLISSFLASLFIGDYAPIDWSDGSGMNLLNIHTKTWDTILLKTCAPKLNEKLGQPVPTLSIIGLISNYFVKKYGFSEKCRIITFTGDNPSSLVGLGLKQGDIACSLGTSDTLFFWMKEAKVIENGHVLCNPLDEQSYMGLLGFKNGSLTRERIRNEFANGSWELFNTSLNNSPLGNGGNLAMYWDNQEIMFPLIGDNRFDKDNCRIEKFASNDIDIRAVIEGQFITRRIFAEDFGFAIDSTTKVVVTGGASVNKAILQTIADVFNSAVYVSNSVNSAALGGAYLAKLASVKERDVRKEQIDKLSQLQLVCEPHKNAQAIYDPLIKRFRSILQQLIQDQGK